MTELLKALLFGIVEGVTEWLPVSSTGHMILLNELVSLRVSAMFMQMFLVVIQLGAIMAVVILYWNTIWPFRRDAETGKVAVDKETISLWVKIIVACLPAAVVGILADDWLDVQKLEEERRALDLAKAADECKLLALTFEKVAKGDDASESEIAEMFSQEDLFEYNFFSNISMNAIKLLQENGGAQWFARFMTGWTNYSQYLSNGLVGGDLYSDANFRLNVMIKLECGKIITRIANLVADGVSASEWSSDEAIAKYMANAQKLNSYLARLDQRNMPAFPANTSDGSPSYIPENCYFMMGDNRYNSLDMRHSYDYKLIPITKFDELSITYYSNMEPQFVNRSKILGRASLRIWPLNRFGLIK